MIMIAIIIIPVIIKNDIMIIVIKLEVQHIVKTRMKERWQRQLDKEREGRYLYRIQRKVGEVRWTERNRR